VWVDVYEDSGGGFGGGFGGGSSGGGYGPPAGGGGGGSAGPQPCTVGSTLPKCNKDDNESGFIISNNPKVKYPEGSNYAEKYPKLTEYLKNQLPKLKDNEAIIKAIVKYGDLSAEK